MVEAISVFKNFITIFLSQHNFSFNSDVILIFQGFPLGFFEALNQLGIDHFSKQLDTKYPDFEKISGNKLLSSFVTSKGLHWGFYEDLIALSMTLNNFSVYNGKILIVKNNIFHDYYPIPIKIDIPTVIKLFENEKTKKDENKLLQFYSDYKIENDILLISYVNKHFDIDIGVTIDECDFYQPNTDLNTSSNNIKTVENISISSLIVIKCDLQNGKLSSMQYLVNGENKILSKEIAVLNSLGKEYNVLFALSTIKDRTTDEGKQYIHILKKYWSTDATYRMCPFYENPALSSNVVDISQGTIISDIILQCEGSLNKSSSQYSDIIITAPTGAGKSLFFQIPGIHLSEKYEALTIVICPLVALMIDQVKELNDRGIETATFINSALTYEERQSRIDGIKGGRYSIVYLSPELLLAYDIQALIGNRIIGLMVVDEAHLVTSWGRDFRVDYWFLGDYIEKIRRGSYYSKSEKRSFPVLCLTATAVFGGRDDVIGDLQNSLHLTCYADHMYIGYVRRENIIFNIRHPHKQHRSEKEEKISLTVTAIKNFIEKKEKTIVYFPYTSQIEDVKKNLDTEHSLISDQVEKYYSSDMKTTEKDEAYNNFRENKSLVMMATKAFGMGVNIPDIVNVYHYAPTGTLADYVQEIGRAARQLMKGYAITDYLPTDMHYVRTLWGLSGLRHYQIKAIIKKLYNLYEEKQHRNLLFSPEIFSFLFDEKSIDTKVKSGLMLLSTDLLEKYHFKVITVRPKNLFSKQYIIVPKEIEEQFLSDYGKYCIRMNDCYPQIEHGYGNNSEVIVKKNGNVFEIDLAALWEKAFVDLSFAQFKYQFFLGKLFPYAEGKIVPNMKLIISYDTGFNEISKKFSVLATAIQNTFNDIKNEFGGRYFTSGDFLRIFNNHYKQKIRREYALMLLELFCYNQTDIYDIPSESWKFIAQKKTSNNSSSLVPEIQYCIRTQKYAYIQTNLLRFLKQSSPNFENSKKYVTYLPIPRKGSKLSYQMLLASILQLFDFASYELIGGRNPQIFVRINDPLKLKRIAESEKEYRNSILTDIEERHKRAVTIMNRFLNGNYSNDERWGIVEDYFLGNDLVVNTRLGITEDS
jgi:ATP-dependent DNA helicase RecQ